jgi:hypothetical protein
LGLLPVSKIPERSLSLSRYRKVKVRLLPLDRIKVKARIVMKNEPMLEEILSFHNTKMIPGRERAKARTLPMPLPQVAMEARATPQ